MKTSKRIILLCLIAALFFLAGFLLSYEEVEMPSCSFSDSDNIIPIVNDQYFNITFNAVSNAKNSIDIVLYEFKWYDSNNSVVKLREALVNAVQRNVTVCLFIDQTNYRDVITELSKENKKTGDYLASKGVLVKYDEWKTTTHDKLLIIDDETVILGSHNWGYSAFERNNEASVLIKDKEIAGYYAAYFEKLWE